MSIVRWIGRIDETNYNQVLEKLKDLDGQEFTLLISSEEGGWLRIAKLFLDEIKYRDLKMNTYISGRVSSAAIPIAVSGNEVVMEEDAHIFFHPLEFWDGEEEELVRNMKYWYKKVIANASEKLSSADVEKIMNEEALIDADKAQSLGLISSII